MKILNLYAGIGGNRKLWGDYHEITAVEHNEDIAKVYQDFYPNDKVIVGDAHQYLLDHYKEFDFIWSSPPCQSHSKMVKATRHKVKKYPDMSLYQEIILLRGLFKGRFVIENVVPFYKPLVDIDFVVGRHAFWSNLDLSLVEDIKRPKGFIDKAKKKDLMDWLGIHIDKNIYYDGNHCPLQIFRNCVHPEIGKQVMDIANG